MNAISVSGGRSRVICESGYGVGGTWRARGGIVFSSVTELDKRRTESGHIRPTFLPDGRRFLFLARTTASESARIEIGSLDGGPRKVVLEADALVGFVPPWLVFVRSGVMSAVTFDPDSGAISGQRAVVASDPSFNEAWATTGASVAGNVLAWYPYRLLKTRASWFREHS